MFKDAAHWTWQTWGFAARCWAADFDWNLFANNPWNAFDDRIGFANGTTLLYLYDVGVGLFSTSGFTNRFRACFGYHFANLVVAGFGSSFGHHFADAIFTSFRSLLADHFAGCVVNLSRPFFTHHFADLVILSFGALFADHFAGCVVDLLGLGLGDHLAYLVFVNLFTSFWDHFAYLVLTDFCPALGYSLANGVGDVS